jgi:hypothetical protein
MQDVEKEAENTQEPENLDDVELGLSDDAIVAVYASERLQCARSYQVLTARLETVEASVTANKSVGNKSAADKFEKQAQELEIDRKHCLRGIKTIDRACPKAKAKMQEVLAQVR